MQCNGNEESGRLSGESHRNASEGSNRYRTQVEIGMHTTSNRRSAFSRTRITTARTCANRRESETLLTIVVIVSKAKERNNHEQRIRGFAMLHDSSDAVNLLTVP